MTPPTGGVAPPTGGVAPPTRGLAPPTRGLALPLSGAWLPPLWGVAPQGLQVVLWRSHQQTGPGSSPTRSQPHGGAAESRGKAMPLSF